MKTIGEILNLTQDLKTDQPYLCTNDKRILEYKHTEIPEANKCKYCGKELYYRGLVHPFKEKTIMKWLSPKPCECEKSKKASEIAEKKRKEEIEREEIEKVKREKRQKIEKLFELSKMGERFKKRNFSSFIANEQNKQAYDIAKAFVKNFDKAEKEGLGIMFTGNYGAGKTHLACSIAIELINKGIPVIYGTAITLLGKIKESYENKDINEWNLLDLYSTTDLLIIDDLGKEKPSEWVLEKLYYIINQRYENLKPVIITTNYDSDTLKNRLTIKDNSSTAEAIISRLNEMCTGIYMNCEDYRKK